MFNNVVIKNKCYFCGGDHECKKCPVEMSMSTILKKKVGILMEKWISDNIYCPECEKQELKVLGNHTPSLDIICNNCNSIFEVKSKCLSVKTIPNDINIQHGVYVEFINRIQEGLNLFLVIYGVNRITKSIKIKEILYANNILLQNKKLFNIYKRQNSKLSIIDISDKNKLKKIFFNNKKGTISFLNDFNNYKQNIVSV
jgi:hypothetical protein